MAIKHRVFISPPSIVGGKGSSKSILIPANLPDPLTVWGSCIAMSGSPWSSGENYQLFHLGIDPGGKFYAQSGYPQNESAPYDQLIALARMEKWPGNTRQPPATFFPQPYVVSRAAGDRFYTEAYDTGSVFYLNYWIAYEVPSGYMPPDIDNMINSYTMFWLGDDGQGNFIDRSYMGHDSPHSIQTVGSVQLSNAWDPFNIGGNSLLCNGTGGLEIPTSPDLTPQLPTVDFTYQVSFMATDLAAQNPQTVMTFRNGADFSAPFHLAIYNNRLILMMGSNSTTRDIANNIDCLGVDVQENQTYRILITRRANTMQIYNNGVRIAQWTISSTIGPFTTTAPLRLGFQAGGSQFTGYIGEVGIHNHYARRFGGNFTPWTSPPE